MSYMNYVIGAYAVFVVVLLWDFVATAHATSRANCAPPRLRATRKAARPQRRHLSRTESE